LTSYTLNVNKNVDVFNVHYFISLKVRLFYDSKCQYKLNRKEMFMASNSNSGRGLAKADQETRERVASMGGQAQPVEEKRKAGQKGGSRSRSS
jgi:hypothetical protein